MIDKSGTFECSSIDMNERILHFFDVLKTVFFLKELFC